MTIQSHHLPSPSPPTTTSDCNHPLQLCRNTPQPITSLQLENRFKLHEKPAFRVAWNPHDYDLLASASFDGYVVVFDSTGKTLSKFRHPDSVYGCAWSPTNKNLLATCCHDGVVRVWDITSTTGKPEHEFVGHGARAFNVAWSPLLEGYLASASDDSTVKVWKLGEVLFLQDILFNNFKKSIKLLVKLIDDESKQSWRPYRIHP